MNPFDFGHPLVDLPHPLSHLPVISLTNPALFDRQQLNEYVETVRKTSASGLVWGGYLEKRFVYSSSPHFLEKGLPRNIHLGIDVFGDAGLSIHAPLAGTVHSFQDNFGESNYGPTIVLQHEGPNGSFHTLYGHLARTSLEGMEIGRTIAEGEVVGTLGKASENGNWPPHLHFQMVVNMENWSGDYPGACTEADLEYYRQNCPDPMDFMA